MKLWKKVNVCGHEYEVFLCEPSEMPDKTYEGYTDVYRCRILLRNNTHPSRRTECLLHELQHAIWDVSGLGHVIQESLRFSTEQEQELEETIIRILSPGLLTTLRGAGLWKEPK